MVKKTVQIEVDFPECSVCGKGIFEDETFFDITFRMSKMTVMNKGGSFGCIQDNASNPIRICRNCFPEDEMPPIMKLILIRELERQKHELEGEKE